MIFIPRRPCLALLLGLTSVYARAGASENSSGVPAIERNGAASQLVVDGKPFLILGGELHNSSSSSLEYMAPIWDRLAAAQMNTVLAGVSWELVEPEEGRFDFRLVDGLIRDARAHHLHLVFLWFGSWKNGASSYPPLWVKRDLQRFPRAKIAGSTSGSVLSVFAPKNAEADAHAFGALLEHVRAIDGREHTVLMTQVENEVGILGDSRDHSDLAEAAFNAPVPTELLNFLNAHSSDLSPELKAQLTGPGRKASGTWSEVFGSGPFTDEIFMAWHYARYINRVAEAGKKAYPLPLYANAWLNGPKDHPGDFPSGGPLAEVHAIWKAAAPNLDLLSPDIYVDNFEERCAAFTRAGNPLFIPEMKTGPEAAKKVFVAVGSHAAIGVSPFGIDDTREAIETSNAAFGQSYALLEQLSPLILKAQTEGSIVGFALDQAHSSVVTHLNGYELTITLDEIFGHSATQGGGVIMADGTDKFIGAGEGFRVSFRPTTSGPAIANIAAIDEGVFKNGTWIPGRRLNGDENEQGGHWRFSPEHPSIERCSVFRQD